MGALVIRGGRGGGSPPASPWREGAGERRPPASPRSQALTPLLLFRQVLTPSSGSLDYAISMRPEYHQAIIDVVKFYGWKHIIYMYDSHDGEYSSACMV